MGKRTAVEVLLAGGGWEGNGKTAMSQSPGNGGRIVVTGAGGVRGLACWRQ